MGRYPSNGAANRRSLVPRDRRERSRGRAHLSFGTYLEERPVRTSFDSSSTLVKRNRGTDFITVSSVDLTDAICSLALRCRGADVHPWMDAGLLEAATA